MVVLTVWYRLVSHKILLPCFSLTRKNVALTFWPTKPKLTNSRPKSNRKGQKYRKKVTITTKTVKGHNIATEFFCPSSVWREKNVALTFLTRPKLAKFKTKLKQKKAKNSGKRPQYYHTTLCPDSVWQEKLFVLTIGLNQNCQIQGQNQNRKKPRIQQKGRSITPKRVLKA